MKLIPKFYFAGDATKAIEKYRKAFDCKVRSLLFYKDAVENGWEKPNPAIESSLYHCEIMFGEQEVRFQDTEDAEVLESFRKFRHAIGFKTEEEVRKAFEVLSEDGKVISPLEKPPYMVIIGVVKDCFGITWELMCDYNYE